MYSSKFHSDWISNLATEQGTLLRLVCLIVDANIKEST